MDHVTECPSCHAQLQVKLQFASSPKVSKERSSYIETDIGALLDKVDEDLLNDKEREFYLGTKKRYQQYKDKTRMTEPQMEWLKDIANKEF